MTLADIKVECLPASTLSLRDALRSDMGLERGLEQVEGERL